MELVSHFDQALRRLNWLQVRSPDDPATLTHPRSQSGPCWLRACSELHDSDQSYLTNEGRCHIQYLLRAGWTLRSRWPRDWSASIDHWLGRRLILGHASLFAANTRLISLVSSRMGRHGYKHPEWPHWLDGALRFTRRHRARLLVVPETTLAAAVEHFSGIVDVPYTTVHWTAHAIPQDWLYDMLSALVMTPTSVTDLHEPAIATPRSLFISPSENQPSQEFQALPLRDRLALTLADSVLVFTMRAAGKLERLVAERLQDPLFPTGSVFVTLPRANLTGKPTGLDHVTKPAANPTGKPANSQTSTQTDWMNRGAVGWVACPIATTARSPLHHCRSASGIIQQRPLWQLSGPLPAAWCQLEADDDWPYLVHCTRSTMGPFPDESVESFRERVWLRGDSVALHPLETLARICREQRLRATSGITRTASPCVSFSAVPLVPLLSRRRFQVHLGRWDWEPYGLLICRKRLAEAGAAQVIYGSQADFLKLPAEKKPLFQPSHRKHGKSNEASWREEREWRVLHDVNLQSVAADSIIVFARTRTQAQQLAQYTPWPVLWTERQ